MKLQVGESSYSLQSLENYPIRDICKFPKYQRPTNAFPLISHLKNIFFEWQHLINPCCLYLKLDPEPQLLRFEYAFLNIYV